MSNASSAYDNSVSANLNTLVLFRLRTQFSVAPSDANPTIELYGSRSINGGSTYENDPLTGGANQGHMHLDSFPVTKVTSAQEIIIGPVPLLPLHYKYFLDNQAGQPTTTTSNTLDIGIMNLEGQ